MNTTPFETKITEPTIEEKRNQRTSHYRWIISGGILMILFGIISLAVPVATSVALGWLLGLIFLASGASQLLHILLSWRDSGKVSRIFLAGLAIVAGILTLRRPVAGMIAITLILAFYLIISGIGKWLYASEIRPETGWGWLALSAGISIVLGAALVIWFPLDMLIVPAIFLGVDLIFFGCSLVGFGATVSRLHHNVIEEKKPFKAA